MTKNIHLPFNSNLTSLKQGIEDDRGQGVDTQQWKHILTLLSVAVVVDNRVYKEEVDMFVERALSLKDIITPDMLFSKKMAFDWFVVHRDEVKAWLSDVDPHTIILRHILALGESPFRKNILDAIYAIAKVDGEYHVSEIDMIGMACKHWHLPRPDAN